ncbi:MAG TPA: DUF6152 family protein [Bryobacteraceae bacterium]|jgi:hypothetical protein|nr:DUF6152 family protein [Bryobacteraceae bacterium]
MNKALLTFLAAAALVLIPATAEAHHGWSDFNAAAEVTFQGTVIAFHYTNPHCVVEFEVTDDKGQVRKWEGEFASPGELQRKGWNANSLETGDKLTISGHPSKDGSPAIHVSKIITNGKELQLEKYSR